MPRHKPTKVLDILGKLDSKITKAIPDYFVSKQCDIKSYLKPPNADGFVETPEVFYLSCQREYTKLLELQKEALIENKRRDIVNAHHNDELCVDQQMLRQKFVSCTIKLKELKEKEDAANLTKEYEGHQQDLMKAKSEEHRASMSTLAAFRTQFQQTVSEYDIYDNYMRAFLNEFPEHSTSESFINRMDALMLANVDITAMNESVDEDINSMRAELVSISRDIANSVMTMKNELDFFQRAFVKVCNEVREMQELLMKIRNEWLKKENANYRTVEGMYNLYVLLCRRRGIYPSFKNVETHKICLFVKNEFDVLSVVDKHLEKIYLK